MIISSCIHVAANGINEPIYEGETDSWAQRTDLWLPSGGQKEGTEVSRCQVLSVYIGQINSKVLLHSTGNYIEYDNQNRKERTKESVCVCVCVCVCVKLHCFAVQQKLMQQCRPTMPP